MQDGLGEARSRLRMLEITFTDSFTDGSKSRLIQPHTNTPKVPADCLAFSLRFLSLPSSPAPPTPKNHLLFPITMV